MTHPGKKLLFISEEFRQVDEWKDLEDLDWVLHNNKIDRLMNDYFKNLMNLYQLSKALWELDKEEWKRIQILYYLALTSRTHHPAIWSLHLMTS